MAHLHEKIDFTVSVFVVYQDTVLIRMHEKFGIWLGVGGHIELDEDPNQAAVREVKEEVGLDIELIGNPKPLEGEDGGYRELIPPKYLNRHNISVTHEHVDFIYYALSDSNAVVPENATDEWKWFTREMLEKNEEGLKSNVLFYAQDALRELGMS